MRKLIEAKHIIIVVSILMCMILTLGAMICYFYTDQVYPILFLFILIISIIISQKNSRGDSIDFFNS